MAGAAIGGGAGALIGLIKHNQEKAEYNRQKELAAQMEQYSPWTHVHGEMPKNNPNLFNSVFQGATQGASMGSGLGGMGSSWGGGAAAAADGAPGTSEEFGQGFGNPAADAGADARWMKAMGYSK